MAGPGPGRRAAPACGRWDNIPRSREARPHDHHHHPADCHRHRRRPGGVRRAHRVVERDALPGCPRRTPGRTLRGRDMGGLGALYRRLPRSACSSSPPGTTGTSPTAATAWAGSPNSSWPSEPPPRYRRDRCGGPATIGCTIDSLISTATCTRPGRASGGATWAGSCPPSTRTATVSTIKDFAAYPELRFLERCWWIGPVMLAGVVLPGRWLGGPADRLLSVHRAPLARHLPGQFHGPHDRPPALRHPGHQPELLVHRPPHRRRGMAQQPPLPAGLVPAGLRLVGDRRHLVRLAGAVMAASGPRPEGPAGTPARSGPGARRCVRHRHVPLLLGAGRQGDRGAHRRPERPTGGVVPRRSCVVGHGRLRRPTAGRSEGREESAAPGRRH